jgi:predicted DCC family thiol-disulfide oxidoreductase YuxK
VRPVVLYDADCNFCATVAAALASWDHARRVRFATIQGPLGEEHLADLPPAERLQSFHFVDGQGTRHSGGAALPALFQALPAGAPLAAGLRLVPGPTDLGYRWVADHRVGISRWLPSRAKRWGRAKLKELEDA